MADFVYDSEGNIVDGDGVTVVASGGNVAAVQAELDNHEAATGVAGHVPSGLNAGDVLTWTGSDVSFLPATTNPTLIDGGAPSDPTGDVIDGGSP